MTRFTSVASGLGMGVLLIVASFCLPAPAVAGDWTGNANFFLGQKMLDSDDWEPLEDQVEVGAEVSWGMKDWPVLIATDVLRSYDDDEISGVDIEAYTTELDLGVRKIWDVDSARPYVGGGLAIVGASVEASQGGLSVDDDDNGVGLWVGGGVFWRLGSRFNIGGALRYSNADVNFGGGDVAAGGLHLGLLLGWGWPATK